MDKKEKTFAQNFSPEFEKLMLEISKDIFEVNFKVIASGNTKEKSDGGYDGYLLIKSLCDRVFTALIEAKLRTNMNDLPLADFSKSVIIAINLDASYITIGTNVYFSSNTISQLKKFAFNTGLEIRTIDNLDIFEWIKKYPLKCNQYDSVFINGIKEYSQHNHKTACRDLSLFNEPYTAKTKKEEYKLYGSTRKRIRNKIVETISESFGTQVIRGKRGTGKKYLAKSAIENLKHNNESSGTKYITCEINLNSITSQADFILNIISLMWGCSCDETIDFLNDLTYSKENENVFRLLSDAAIYSLSKLAKIYSKDIDTDVFFTYIASLYDKMFEKRKLKRIFLLYNIEKVIDTNVYNIVISFVRKMSSKMSIVVCVPSDLDLLEKNDWEKFCIDLYESENIKSYDLNEWKNENAIEYIKDSTADSHIIERADDIVKYFGLNPARLSAALDMIKKDKMMLSYICNNNFELSEFFDTKKLKSAFEFSIKKLSDIQCEIVYLMYLFEDGIEIKDISYILNVQNEIVINEIQKLPYLIMQQTSCYWKNNIYIDLIKGDESRLLYQLCGLSFLQQLITKIKKLRINKIKTKEILLSVYIQLCNSQRVTELSNDLLTEYKKNEQYGKIYKIICMLKHNNFLPKSKKESFNLRIEWLYSAIKLGHNGEDSDVLDEFISLVNDIENHCESMDESYISPLILGRFYYVSSLIHLSKSDYEKMVPDIKKGLEYLKEDMSKESVELQSELCGIFSTALKHLENIESAVSYLEKNETIEHNPKIKDAPRYIISYHTQYASLFTGSNPKFALDEFMKISDVCKKYSKEAYLHNLHNIASMKFALGDYPNALKDALIVQKETYENNFSIEFGRCQNIMGCLMWQQGNEKAALEYFVSSYKHFEKHQHNTHVWAPLVNLSVLTTRLGDSEAERFTKEAYDFLVKHHLKQIKSAIINDTNLPPKIVVAILMLFYNFEQLGYNSLEMLFKQINDERLLKLYDKYVKGCCFEDLFKGSAYNCDGKIMLKV